LTEASAQIRTLRAGHRRELKQLDYWGGRDYVADLLESRIPEYMKAVVLYDLLTMIRYMSGERAVRFLIYANCPNVPLAQLSYPQRERMVNALRGELEESEDE
jgi:hypothetical protein